MCPRISSGQTETLCRRVDAGLPNPPCPALQTPQEIQQVLLFGVPERTESPDHGVGFRRREVGIAPTRVRGNRNAPFPPSEANAVIGRLDRKSTRLKSSH